MHITQLAIAFHRHVDEHKFLSVEELMHSFNFYCGVPVERVIRRQDFDNLLFIFTLINSGLSSSRFNLLNQWFSIFVLSRDFNLLSGDRLQVALCVWIPPELDLLGSTVFFLSAPKRLFLLLVYLKELFSAGLDFVLDRGLLLVFLFGQLSLLLLLRSGRSLWDDDWV